LFFVSKSWAADDEIVALLSRIAENVSFALDNFGRAKAKAVADQQQERLTRMFAALSATNEAIMRAKSRTELFDLVCAAAATGGKFTSTTIALVKSGSDYLDIVATGGPAAVSARGQDVYQRSTPRRARRVRHGVPFGSGLYHKRLPLRFALRGVSCPGAQGRNEFRRVVSVVRAWAGGRHARFGGRGEGHIHARVYRIAAAACAQNMVWQRRGQRPGTMAVNLSPRQFSDPHLLHDVDEALLVSGMSPVLLQLGVTESMVMRNVSRAIKVLDAIQSRGIRLAIDDFGNGYSSMSLMKQFPIDTIKIDRSFVRDLPVDTEDQAIAQAIISMGKALGMTVIAEGVETLEQGAFLRSHACDEMQGFLFSKPLPAREMAGLLRAESQIASPALQPSAGRTRSSGPKFGQG
jgi:EAL domain-containing protein (putative c-di-GMP-specific phosphodiesterase class I)